ncbi:MAG: hypothetical protein R3C14_44640 [Caldilineaceae bacterium]
MNEWLANFTAGKLMIYTRRSQWLLLCLATTLSLLGCAWLSLHGILAQELAPTVVTPIVDQYPLITIRDRCPTAVAADDPARVWMVAEDDIVQEVLTSTRQLVRPQSQNAILIDLFDHKEAVLGPIDGGLTRLYQLYATSVFTVATDALALYLPGPNGTTLDTVTPWTGDAGLILNATRKLSPDRPYSTLDHTALATLLQGIVQDMLALPLGAAQTVRQNIVVFSDGTDVVNGAAFDELIRTAQTHQIRIYTVFIETGYANRANLNRLATATGGQSVQLDEQMAWDTLWRALIDPVSICEVTYRSNRTQPKQLAVWEVVGGTVQFTRTYTFPPLKPSPPAVQIDTPRVGSEVVLPADGAAAVDATLPLLVTWNFASYPPRKIQRIVYALQGPTSQPIAEVAPPTGLEQAVQIAIPLQALTPGPYAVQVQVEDELGLMGEANAPFALALPTATPTATPTTTPLPTATAPPKATPLPTATPYWHVPPVRWSIVDFPYRLLLVLTAPLWGGLIWGFYRLWRRRRTDSWDGTTTSLRRGDAVNAILYRVDGEPEQPLKQVVKLSNRSNDVLKLPNALYTSQGVTKSAPGAKQESIAQFQAEIQVIDARYRLKVGENSKPIRYKRQGREDPIADELQLAHNDTLVFGQNQYVFYILKDLATLPSAVTQSLRRRL